MTTPAQKQTQDDMDFTEVPGTVETPAFLKGLLITGKSKYSNHRDCVCERLTMLCIRAVLFRIGLGGIPCAFLQKSQ